MHEPNVVASGSWLYANTAPMPVLVVRLDYDFWYEIAKEEGTLEEGETPHLDERGQAYYVSYREPCGDRSFWPDSGPHLSISEAKVAAESRLPSPVTWTMTT